MDYEEFEEVRGEIAPRFTTADSELPCIEVSSSSRLCKRPLVSVVMLAYNHSAFIRKAIDGVLAQVTDFEYEVLIGEDASPDNTREICFEYQKKYPEKIRVLWSPENLYDQDGNERRAIVRCRGEYFAVCECDDYWTDTLKLQKQVDVLRKYPNVGLCFTDVTVRYEKSGAEIADGERFAAYKRGMMTGDSLFDRYLLGIFKDGEWNISRVLVRTPTTMFRKSVYDLAAEKYDVMSHRMYLTDVRKVLAVASLSDIYYLDDVTAVYRVNAGGVCSGCDNKKVWLDAWLLRWYFAEIKGRSEDVKRLERICCLKRLTQVFALDECKARDYICQISSVGRYACVMMRLPMRLVVKMFVTPYIPYRISLLAFKCAMKYLKLRRAFV